MLFKWGVFSPPSEIWQIILEYVDFVGDCKLKIYHAEDILETIHTNCLSTKAFNTMCRLLKTSHMAPDISLYCTNLHIKEPDVRARNAMLEGRAYVFGMCRLQNITDFLVRRREAQENAENVDNEVINEQLDEHDDQPHWWPPWITADQEEVTEGGAIQWVPETP